MVSDHDISAALTAVHALADSIAPRPADANDAARDAATDAVLWAIANYQSERGSFSGMARSAAKRFIQRAMYRRAHKYAQGPVVLSLSGVGDDGRDVDIAGPIAVDSLALPDSLQQLPEDLRHVVRLFYIDQFDMRECGLLLGVGHETVRRWLGKAAKLLQPHSPRSSRRNGEKRLVRQ